MQMGETPHSSKNIIQKFSKLLLCTGCVTYKKAKGEDQLQKPNAEKQILSFSCQKFFHSDADYQQQVIYSEFLSCPLTDSKGI